MIGPIFGLTGVLWGYLLAKSRSGRQLDRIQYGEGFTIASGLLGTVFGTAFGRYLGVR